MKSLFVCAVTLAAVLSWAESAVRTIDLPLDGERNVIRVETGGASRVSVEVELPICDIQQVWAPELHLPLVTRKWRLDYATAPQCQMPYLAFMNMAGENRFSFGARALEYDCKIESRINQEKGVYRIRLTVATDGPAVEPFDLTLDRRGIPWMRALGEWREGLGYPKGRYPEGAWAPVYCSWYAAHADIDAAWVEEQATIAAKIGFGTFILDDGWCYDDRKRVNPKTLSDWYRDTGRWDVFSEKKFPDFKVHRKKIRALGLNYLVWVAPYFVGTSSPVYLRYGSHFAGQQPFEGNVLADPSDSEIMNAVSDQLVSLLANCDLDGLKIDFLDSIASSVEKPRGYASLKYFGGLMSRLKAVRPDGLFEFRQGYATPLTAQYATQFRAGDVPFEWLANLQRIVQIRLAMGDRIPIHADPICWSGCETEENVSRHFIAAMAGVPMVSMDLKKMSDRCRSLVEKWLRFYRAHVECFQREGHWDVAYKNGGLAYVTAELSDRVFVIVNDSDCTAKYDSLLSGRKGVVLNLGMEPIVLGATRKIGPAECSVLLPLSGVAEGQTPVVRAAVCDD